MRPCVSPLTASVPVYTPRGMFKSRTASSTLRVPSTLMRCAGVLSRTPT
jgi:hypothetical protein